MTKMIQVRDVPDSLHRELVRRAKRADLSLTDYVQHILEREVARPPVGEVLDRIAARTRVDLGTSAAAMLRAERAERGAS